MENKPITRAELRSIKADLAEAQHQRKVDLQKQIGYQFADEMYKSVKNEAEREQEFCDLNTYKMSAVAITTAINKLKEYFPDCDVTNISENPLMAPNMSKIRVSWS